MIFLHSKVSIFEHYNNAIYYYRKDIQGNIIAILDSNGAVVVKYKYDAWGKCKVLDAASAYYQMPVFPIPDYYVPCYVL